MGSGEWLSHSKAYKTVIKFCLVEVHQIFLFILLLLFLTTIIQILLFHLFSGLSIHTCFIADTKKPILSTTCLVANIKHLHSFFLSSLPILSESPYLKLLPVSFLGSTTFSNELLGWAPMLENFSVARNPIFSRIRVDPIYWQMRNLPF